MKLTCRASNRVRIAVREDRGESFDVVDNDPAIFTPLELRNVSQQKYRGLQDVPMFYRGDTLTIIATLLDYRGDPMLNLDDAVEILLGVKKMVPVQAVLFTVVGTVTDSALGVVEFDLTDTETNQADVDEALGNIRIEEESGGFITFETFPVQFLNSAFT